MRHHLGIDRSSLFVSRNRVRNETILCGLVGPQNYAAKLFNVLLDVTKFSAPPALGNDRPKNSKFEEKKTLYKGDDRTFKIKSALRTMIPRRILSGVSVVVVEDHDVVRSLVAEFLRQQGAGVSREEHSSAP